MRSGAPLNRCWRGSGEGCAGVTPKSWLRSNRPMPKDASTPVAAPRTESRAPSRSTPSPQPGVRIVVAQRIAAARALYS